MEEACKAVEDRIISIGGTFNFHMKPKVVTATDEADLAKQLERAEQENAEVGNWYLELAITLFLMVLLIYQEVH